MKRCLIILITVTVIFGFVSLVAATGTATVSFLPESKEVSLGESFNIDIVVDPVEGSLDTVRAVVNFPADKLEATYFALKNLYPQVGPGNYIDNENGILSQGGTIFGGQTSEKGIFGTITFKALAAGEVEIFATENSRLIRSGQEKIDLSNLGSAVITINEEEVKVETAEELKKIPDRVVVESASHSDQEKWYSDNLVRLSWEMAEGSGEVVSYFYAFDQDPGTDPVKTLDKEQDNRNWEDVDDGIWYFHIKAQFPGGSFGGITHYRVMIDTVAPQKFLPMVEIDNIREGETTELRFGTLDQTSGVDFYDLAIDGGAFEKQTSPYTLKGLKAGEHIIIVRAVDKAENVSANAIKVNVLPKEKLEIFSINFWKKYGIWIGLAILIIILLLIGISKRKRK